MRTLLRSLFAPKAQPARTTSRSPRLGVERLDERLLLSASPLLSATTGLLLPAGTTTIPGTSVSAAISGSTLGVQASGTGETVVVRGSGSTRVVIEVTEADGSVHSAASLPFVPVPVALRSPLKVQPLTQVKFQASGQQDTFINQTALASSFSDSALSASYSPATRDLSVKQLGTSYDMSISTRLGTQWLYVAQSGSWYQPGGPIGTLGGSPVQGGDTTSIFHEAPNIASEIILSVSPQDDGLRKVFVQDVTRDYLLRGLTRSDMLDLFSQAGKDATVSAQELADLRSLAASSLRMPDDVRNLTGKVVNHDAANALFGTQALGDLHAGSTSAKLNLLVQKWFSGADLPALPGDWPASAQLHYEHIGTPLFGSGGPSVRDGVQGGVDDGYLVAGLMEVAQQNPQAIRDMFHDNGDGTWTVRFFIHGSANYVTVNDQLPVYTYGGGIWHLYAADRVYQVTPGQDGQPWTVSFIPVWVALAEKAYAQMNQEGVLDRGSLGSDYSGVNSYGGTNGFNGGIVGGDPATALWQITGRTGLAAVGTDTAFAQAQYTAGNYVLVVSNAAPPAGVYTWGDTVSPPVFPLEGNTTYIYLGVDPTTGRNVLADPAGGAWELTDAQMAQDIGVILSFPAQGPLSQANGVPFLLHADGVSAA